MSSEQIIRGKIGDISCWGICHPTEDPAKIETAMCNILGMDATFERTESDSHFDQKMILITGHVKGNSSLAHILSRMSADDRRDLLAQLEERLDDSNRLHARFDKQSAFAGFPRLYTSTDPSLRKQKDSVDLEIRFTTYPGRREAAISFIRRFIIGEIEKQG